MSIHSNKIGIVGGSGMLGRAISLALLGSDSVKQEDFWISNRSGDRVGFDDWPAIHVTKDNHTLTEACQVIILCVPPDQFRPLSLHCEDKLIISVMAGVSIKQLQNATHTQRVVRAMCSPAAEFALAYSPWFASESIGQNDRDVITCVFDACGKSDELQIESHIELFTAMTGPVPGFVAYFADCVSQFAIDNGVSAEIANRAVKQLFLAAGTLMANSDSTPQQDVQDMVDYNGTTAAGLKTMQTSSLCRDISTGLQAAVDKTRQIS